MQIVDRFHATPYGSEISASGYIYAQARGKKGKTRSALESQERMARFAKAAWFGESVERAVKHVLTYHKAAARANGPGPTVPSSRGDGVVGLGPGGARTVWDAASPGLAAL